MSNLNIDLTTLSDVELTKLAAVFPEAVGVEILRRSSFSNQKEMFSALYKVYFQAAHVLKNMKNCRTKVEVMNTGILETLGKVFKTLEATGIDFDKTVTIPEKTLEAPKAEAPKADKPPVLPPLEIDPDVVNEDGTEVDEAQLNAAAHGETDEEETE